MSSNIDNKEPTSTKKSGSNTQQRTARRPFYPWSRDDVSTFKMHITHSCPKAPLEAQLSYFKQLAEDDENQKSKLPLKRQEQLENGMCFAFVCAGVSFNVAGNEIFRAWLQDLRPGFNIPSPRTLAGRIFNKQIIKGSFSKCILSQAILVAQFFRSSHIANSALENEIQINNIVGEGIKQYVATRWSSYYDSIYLILRLKVAFVRILDHNPDIITNDEVYAILNKGDVLTIADEAGELDDNDSDEGSIEDDEIEFESLDELLKLEETFDLNHEIFTEKGQSNSIESNSENVVEEQPNYDYNVDNLIDEMFAK
ncbi:28306_t:CDS:2 [Racocetra persica]|uniref:28306_t:CDS:1 n=1 Tax=Racocetra persica TaxID=160502 RepID=A0ACA9MMZ0_9GLOM|nr:28306_t:CDS:2 [Racocetra persica]